MSYKKTPNTQETAASKRHHPLKPKDNSCETKRTLSEDKRASDAGRCTSFFQNDEPSSSHNEPSSSQNERSSPQNERFSPKKESISPKNEHSSLEAEYAPSSQDASWSPAYVPVRACDQKNLATYLPFPAVDANKYTRGKLIAVVGSKRYPGAATLAACASQRMGAGYTEVITSSSVVPLIQAQQPSLVVRSRKHWDSASLAQVHPRHPQAVVVGCGFDASQAWTTHVVCDVLDQAACPVLVDGGGLSALTTTKAQRLCAQRFSEGYTTILTPHEGEAARLARAFSLEAAVPSELATLLSLVFGATVVLKGATTYVSDGEETVCMCEGTEALAKAGTGDVLAGIIGGLLAQGIQPMIAGTLGALIHARAGKVAADIRTTISVCAEDVIEAIPDAIVYLAAQRECSTESTCESTPEKRIYSQQANQRSNQRSNCF